MRRAIGRKVLAAVRFGRACALGLNGGVELGICAAHYVQLANYMLRRFAQRCSCNRASQQLKEVEMVRCAVHVQLQPPSGLFLRAVHLVAFRCRCRVALPCPPAEHQPPAVGTRASRIQP